MPLSLPRARHSVPTKSSPPLGLGAMGGVYRARDSKLKREVAIKVLSPEFAQDPKRTEKRQQFAHPLLSIGVTENQRDKRRYRNATPATSPFRSLNNLNPHLHRTRHIENVRPLINLRNQNHPRRRDQLTILPIVKRHILRR